MISRFQFSQFICDCSTQWTVRTSDVILYFVLVLKPLGCSAAVSSLNNENASKVSSLLPSLHLHRLHRQHMIMDLRSCTNIGCTSDLRWLPHRFYVHAAASMVERECSSSSFLFFVFWKRQKHLYLKNRPGTLANRGNGKEKVFLIPFFFSWCQLDSL